MKKPLILFIIFVVLIVVIGIAYSKYCASKPEGCKDEPHDTRNLSDDHMDSK